MIRCWPALVLPMHELSLCQGMMRQLTEIAEQQQAACITRVHVRVGPLSGVEPKLLARAFPLASAGTVAAEAELILEEQPVRVRCEQCGAESEVTANRLLCGNCGDYHTRLLSGDELLLASVELTR